MHDDKLNKGYLLVGALQGWALWGLWKARDLKLWPSGDPVSERALLYLSLALPLAIYLSGNIFSLSQKRRGVLLASVSAVFVFLGAYSGWAENPPIDVFKNLLDIPPARPSDLLAAGILGFILMPLAAHYRRSRPHWHYQALFDSAWKNGLMTASATALVGVLWMAILTGALLMKSIGINFIFELVEKSFFSIPVTCIAFGAAFAICESRIEWILTLRRFSLSVLSWFLPLLLLFSTAWVIALPFTGLEPLFKTRYASFTLMWFIALSVSYANAAYQDGIERMPYGRRLGTVLPYLWLSLLVLAVIAWWAMKMRVDQYGWTEDRVWGVFILILATLYTVGYAYSLFMRRGWFANVGNTNIVAALVMVIGLVLLLSPVADARRIAVDSQMQRLLQGHVNAEKVDYHYFRWEAGRYGREALHKLANGIDHPDKVAIADKARLSLQEKNPYQFETHSVSLTQDEMRKRFPVLPEGQTVSDHLLEAVQATSLPRNFCGQQKVECFFWLVDITNDGLPDGLFIIEHQDWVTGQVDVYKQLPTGLYEYAGQIHPRGLPGQKAGIRLRQAIKGGEVVIRRPEFDELEWQGTKSSVSRP